MDTEAWRATVRGVVRVGQDLATKPPPTLVQWFVYFKKEKDTIKNQVKMKHFFLG